MKQIKIRILRTGEIKAETKGMKGKSCLKYITEIEKMADAVTVDSEFIKNNIETKDEDLHICDIQEVED